MCCGKADNYEILAVKLFLQMLAKITEFKKCFVTSPSLKRLQIGLCTLTRIYLASLTYNDSVFLVVETE